jgi:hypothetical protein
MREGQISYQTKLKQIKKQYKLYDAFLVEEITTEIQRKNLITEMVRLSDLINEIEKLPVADFFSKADDYSTEFQSKSNKKVTKNKIKANA